MADIRMFRAFRPVPEMAEKIAALPYDVYNRKEAAEIVRKNPDSFLAIDRAETAFDESVDTYDERVYKKAKELLERKTAAGSFVTEDEPMYYIYALTMDGRTQHGFVACASIDDYEKQIIKKHENIREEKLTDRIRHVESCSAQTGPVFLAYRQTAELKQVMSEQTAKETLYDFISEDGIRHQVWRVRDPETQERIKKGFEALQDIYIADGHHRCASAVKVGLKRRKECKNYTGEEEFNFFLSVLFPEEELSILDYNRVIKDLNGMMPEELLEKLEQDFTVEKLEPQEAAEDGQGIKERETDRRKPSAKGVFSLYLDGCWYKLTARQHCFSDDPVEGLDVSVLQKKVLEPLFGIKDPKTDKRIDFVGGIRGMDELERRCREDCKAAFAVYPTDIRELFAVADSGLLMPPKSTWFEPKLRSGLLIHKF